MSVTAFVRYDPKYGFRGVLSGNLRLDDDGFGPTIVAQY